MRLAPQLGTPYPSGIESSPRASAGPRLYNNQPNPFNPSTRIRFELSHAGPVRLAVFDLQGRLVATLVAGRVEVGPHVADWRGADASGRSVASGVYFCRLEAEGKVRTRTMVLLK